MSRNCGMPMPLEIRAECPICGKNVRIRPDGRFWWRKNDDAGAGPRHLYSARCTGAQYRWQVKGV